MSRRNDDASTASRKGLKDKVLELQTRAEDIQVSISEEEKSREKLSRDKTSLVMQLVQLSADLEALQSKNSQDLEERRRLMRLHTSEKERKARSLREEVMKLERSIESQDVMELESKRIARSISALQESLDVDMSEHERVEKETRDKSFSVRMQLEEITRKTLRDLTVKFENEASEAMRKESSSAVSQNHQLRESLGTHSDHVLKVMDRHQGSIDALTNMRLQRDILEGKRKIQVARLESLEECKLEHEEILHEAQSQIAELHARNKALSRRIQKHDEATDELQQLEDASKAQRRKIQRAKAEAVRFTRKLLNEQARREAGSREVALRNVRDESDEKPKAESSVERRESDTRHVWSSSFVDNDMIYWA